MRLKISYSLIRLWERGDINALIEALNGIWQEPSPAMEYGTMKHKEWEDEVNRTGCMPEIFGGQKLVNPKTEQYYKVQLTDWLWLSGVIDLEYGAEGENLVDYKTGQGNANAYSDSLQAGCYKILRPKAKRFTYKHFNQYENKTSSSIVYLTDKLLLDSLDKVISVGCDIVNTLENLGYADFDNLDSSSRRKKDV
jgi:hypothetical protein